MYPTYLYFFIIIIITKIECWPGFKQDATRAEKQSGRETGSPPVRVPVTGLHELQRVESTPFSPAPPSGLDMSMNGSKNNVLGVRKICPNGRIMLQENNIETNSKRTTKKIQLNCIMVVEHLDQF